LKIQQLLRVMADRRGATALVYGLAMVPMTMLVALAIDFAGVTAAKTRLDLAADAGALTAAVTAAQDWESGTTTSTTVADAAGVAAGQQRFLAQAGTTNNVTVQLPVSVTVAAVTSAGNVTAFTGTLTYCATYTPYLGGLVGVKSIPICSTSVVNTPVSAPYLNIYVLLDNSGSMEIAAQPSDIQTLQELTACSDTSAYYCTSSSKGSCSTWSQSDSLVSTQTNYKYFATGANDSSQQSYGVYGCSGSYNYVSDGLNTCTIGPMSVGNMSFPAFPQTGNNPGPACPVVVLPSQPTSGTSYNGFPVMAGAPCAFACHFDTSSAAGSGQDSYAVARSTIGTSYQITLRFDLVKKAVNQLITTMQTDNLSINNLNVGVYWFADILSPVYPAGGGAGNNWSAALAAVGLPPTTANGPDTGIQPYVGANDGETDFPTIMSQLANQLTAAGTGVNAASPRKVLFIVTDGLQDPSSRAMSAFNPSSCTTFKNMGYAVYVLYTPYYSLMNTWYLGTNAPNPPTAEIVQAAAAASNSIPYNLQQCASAPANYLEATDQKGIADALQTFLKLALAPPARFTQ
jgi:Flp pilus assembly protein TadG